MLQKIEGKITLTFDECAFDVTVGGKAHSKGLSVAEVGGYVGERVQVALDNIISSDVPRLNARIKELSLQYEKAQQALEGRRETATAPATAPDVPQGFRSETVTEKPRRGRPRKDS